jgi:uncharacterized Tic20 family protein
MSYPHDSSLTADEKLWGMLAHLLTLLGYVASVGQYIAPLVIYLVYKDRSKFVAFHALQALFFQMLALAVSVVLVLLTLVTLGVGLIIVIPAFIALTIAVLVYTIWAAIEASRGVWFELPFAGQWARSVMGL